MKKSPIISLALICTGVFILGMATRKLDDLYIISGLRNPKMELVQTVGNKHPKAKDVLTDFSDFTEKPYGIIIFYRYGCKDCIENFDEMKAVIDKYPNVYIRYLPSDSMLGHFVQHDYGILETPALLVNVNGEVSVQYLLDKDQKPAEILDNTLKELSKKG